MGPCCLDLSKISYWVIGKIANLSDSHQGNVEGIFEAEAGGDGQDGVEAGEHGSKQQHLAGVRVDRHLGQVVPQGSQVFILIERILWRS